MAAATPACRRSAKTASCGSRFPRATRLSGSRPPGSSRATYADMLYNFSWRSSAASVSPRLSWDTAALEPRSSSPVSDPWPRPRSCCSCSASFRNTRYTSPTSLALAELPQSWKNVPRSARSAKTIQHLHNRRPGLHQVVVRNGGDAGTGPQNSRQAAAAISALLAFQRRRSRPNQHVTGRHIGLPRGYKIISGMGRTAFAASAVAPRDFECAHPGPEKI